MLIKVFGIWLMAQNINYLHYDEEQNLCAIIIRDSAPRVTEKTCDEVAEEINRQIRESNNNTTGG